MWDLTTIQLNNLNQRTRVRENRPVPMPETVGRVVEVAQSLLVKPITALDAMSKEFVQQ